MEIKVGDKITLLDRENNEEYEVTRVDLDCIRLENTRNKKLISIIKK